VNFPDLALHADGAESRGFRDERERGGLALEEGRMPEQVADGEEQVAVREPAR
jgi:hypothetical protein